MWENNFLSVSSAVFTDMIQITITAALVVTKPKGVKARSTEIAHGFTSNAASSNRETIIVAAFERFITSKASESGVAFWSDAVEIRRGNKLGKHVVKCAASLRIQATPINRSSLL